MRMRSASGLGWIAARLAVTLIGAASLLGCSTSGNRFGGAPPYDAGCRDACAPVCDLCGGVCVDKLHDPNNCGGCGNRCAGGGACDNGVCGCPAGQMSCGGACIVVANDPQNCGACNNACPTNVPCLGGRCVDNTCNGTLCSGVCVDTRADANNCGACFHVCPMGVCNNGQCPTPMCTVNGVRDGNETDVDCGGGLCPPCADGRRCLQASDCSGGMCAANVCGSPMIPTTIAAMRMAGQNGSFSLDNVVAIALTPSIKSPHLFVQDAGGGDYSAIPAKCISTSMTHPCAVAATVASIAIGHSVTVTGSYLRDPNTGAEDFFVKGVIDNGVGPGNPAPLVLTAADVAPHANLQPAHYYQRVSVDASNDPLLMYDFSPADLMRMPAPTNCPYTYGFAMVPTSATAAAGPACMGNMSQPASLVNPSPAELLIGTNFYRAFTLTSDCRCATMFMDKVVTSASTLNATLAGILIFEVPFMGRNGFQYVAPQSLADAPISNTM